jgi:tetratricopeptide (TPR) repeat protein
MLDLAAAHELFSGGLRHGEQDAELLLGLGAVTETIVALRDYEQPGGARGRRDSRDGIRFEIEGEAGEGGRLPPVSLADAQALYAKALQRSPGLLEARVRLGRVLLLRGRNGEALAELRQVSGDAARPSQRYMARLFEGRARERLGDSRGAAEAFSAAAAEVPKAQSALVALGRALDRLGERTRSQEAFDRAVLHEMYAQGDPWLDYIRGQPARIGDLVEELRGLVP